MSLKQRGSWSILLVVAVVAATFSGQVYAGEESDLAFDDDFAIAYPTETDKMTSSTGGSNGTFLNMSAPWSNGNITNETLADMDENVEITSRAPEMETSASFPNWSPKMAFVSSALALFL